MLLILMNVLFIASALTGSNKMPDGRAKYRFATAEEARKLVAEPDNYLRNRGRFDIISRLQNQDGTAEELIALAQNEIQEWTPEEQAEIGKLIEAVNDSIAKYTYSIPFPEEIVLVKTNMADEGGAGGYTRSNWIALQSVPSLQLLMHETFHVLTRGNHDFKRAMYETIGFTVTDDELQFPEDLKDIRISNPDVSRFDSYITLDIDGKPQKCAMLLYADRPYTDGAFFNYLTIGFIPLDEALNPVQENGKTVIYPFDKPTGFFEQIGKNTGYIIDPEEIMAENFVSAFVNQQGLPNPELTEHVRKIILSPLNK